MAARVAVAVIKGTRPRGPKKSLGVAPSVIPRSTGRSLALRARNKRRAPEVLIVSDTIKKRPEGIQGKNGDPSDLFLRGGPRSTGRARRAGPPGAHRTLAAKTDACAMPDAIAPACPDKDPPGPRKTPVFGDRGWPAVRFDGFAVAGRRRGAPRGRGGIKRPVGSGILQMPDIFMDPCTMMPSTSRRCPGSHAQKNRSVRAGRRCVHAGQLRRALPVCKAVWRRFGGVMHRSMPDSRGARELPAECLRGSKKRGARRPAGRAKRRRLFGGLRSASTQRIRMRRTAIKGGGAGRGMRKSGLRKRRRGTAGNVRPPRRCPCKARGPDRPHGGRLPRPERAGRAREGLECFQIMRFGAARAARPDHESKPNRSSGRRSGSSARGKNGQVPAKNRSRRRQGAPHARTPRARWGASMKPPAAAMHTVPRAFLAAAGGDMA